jgi:hypothetical protein
MSTSKGTRNLSKMEQQKSMLDMKVFGSEHLTPSVMNRILTGRIVLNVPRMIYPEADQVKTSIYPGVSIKITLFFSLEISSTLSTRILILLHMRLRQVVIAPLGPSPYYYIISR